MPRGDRTCCAKTLYSRTSLYDYFVMVEIRGFNFQPIDMPLSPYTEKDKTPMPASRSQVVFATGYPYRPNLIGSSVMTRHVFLNVILLLSLLFAPTIGANAQTEPAVRAVLFYSPTCPHCEYVITQTMPPLIQQYEDKLQIIGINVSGQQGSTLFLAALAKFKPQESGVPFLVIGEEYLKGSGDIPKQLPGLIETYLAQGGADLPDIPGLREAMAAAETAAQGSAPSVFALPEIPVELTWQQKFAQDPPGNVLSVIVLIGMIGAVLFTLFRFEQRKAAKDKGKWQLLIPVLCMVGFGVAGYLAYVEVVQVAAVCGPVGDCNTVQQSEYARLFGILPVGVMGLASYVAIFLAWLVARFAKDKIADFAALSLFGMAVSGTLFSIYLTFLEPFVIGATCAWCLTSAVLITVLMLLSLKPAKVAFASLGFVTHSS